MKQSLRFVVLVFVLSAAIHGWSQEWHSYRNDAARSGQQPVPSVLSFPTRVPLLKVGWTWPAQGSEGGSFRASPIVHKGRVFIGSTSGYFYGLNAGNGQQLWRYPGPGQPGLLGSCTNGGNGSWGAYGIQSSASYAKVMGQDAVIFGAPDPTAETHLGSARLFALSMTGALLWKSDVVAHVNGCPGTGPNVLHERIAYSSPLVSGNMVYVGIHDAGDDPIQDGKVVAVNVNTGHIVPGFSFHATSTRGGGVWNSPAADLNAVYFTTGNTRCWNGGCQPEPTPNYGLSTLRVNKLTGHVDWQFQPVPYKLDDDPDWSAGAAVMTASCGELVTSVQKDGWSYALNPNNGSCKWQYPPTAGPTCKFSPNSPHDHGDTDYKQPGAVWKDVIIMKVGGWGLIAPQGYTGGYTKLHALNACATNPKQRVRWMIQVPSATPGDGYSIGAPTVTGGIIYVTTDTGHVVAIADTSLHPPVGHQCTFEFINPANNGPTWPTVCVNHGFQVVPVPFVLADVALPDGSSASNLRNEAAIAEGRLFVGTSGGHVYALWPHH